MRRADAPAAAAGSVAAPTPALGRVDIARRVTSPRARSYAFAAITLGFLWGYGIGSVLAIIFGGVAISKIRDANGWATSGPMATAGILLGIIGVLLTVLIIEPASVAGIT